MKNQTTSREQTYHASDMEFNILNVYKELTQVTEG